MFFASFGVLLLAVGSLLDFHFIDEEAEVDLVYVAARRLHRHIDASLFAALLLEAFLKLYVVGVVLVNVLIGLPALRGLSCRSVQLEALTVGMGAFRLANYVGFECVL